MQEINNSNNIKTSPGWKDPSAGSYFLYTLAKDSATSNDLYAVLEHRKKTPEVQGQMRDVQATVAQGLDRMKLRVLRRADEFDGTIAHSVQGS